MSQINWNDILVQLDLEIRSGRTEEALRKLQLLLKKKPPMETRTQLAMIARRSGNSYLAVQILRPIVRTEGRKARQPTSKEKAEYAAALIFAGAITEAQKLLSNISAAEYPEKLLYETFAYFAQWNYTAALPCLRQYVKVPSLSEYQRLVGLVNLAAAELASNQFIRFWSLTKKLIPQLTRLEAHLLLLNTYELQVQCALKQRNYARMEEALKMADTLTKNDNSIYTFYIKKWRLVSQLQDRTDDQRAPVLSLIAQLKSEALAHRYGEVVRDCDRQVCIYTGNSELFFQVYFGTPFLFYRKNLIRDVSFQIKLPHQWIWTPAQIIFPTQTQPVIDVHDLGLSKKLQTLFIALLSDLYQPLSLGFLFEQIFPNEFFDPKSSTHRINQLLYRLRKELKKRELPIEIIVNKYEYQLISHVRFVLRNAINGISSLSIEYLLKNIFAERSQITNRDVVLALGVSRRTGHRILKEAKTLGYILKQGSGGATTYHMTRLGLKKLNQIDTSI